MANKVIKGLTVEISGDTTKLGQALDSADKQSRALSGELRQIDKLLQFDSANPEMLAQKQEVLTKQISNTEEKLKLLKAAQEQANEAVKNGETIGDETFRALEREIQFAENALKKYQTAADDTAQKISDVGTNTAETAEAVKPLTETVKAQEAELSKLKADYVDIAAAQGADSEEAKKLLSAIGNLSGELSENQKKVQAAKQAADEFDSTISKNTASALTLTETVKAQEKELSALKSQYADTAAEQGADSESAKALAEKISTLSGKLAENKSALSAAKNAADAYDETISVSLAQSIANQQRDLKKLREEYAQAAVTMGGDSAEAQNLASKITALTADLKANEAAYSDAMREAEALGKSDKSLSETVADQQNELKKLRAEYAEIVAVQGADSDEAKRLAGQITALSSDLKANETALKLAEQAAESLGKEEKSLSEITADQKRELSALKEKYTDTAAAKGKDSAEAKSLARQIEALSGELSENQKRLGQAENEADKFDKTVDDLGDSAKDTEHDLSGLTDALGACLKAATAAAAAVGAAAVKLTVDAVNSFGELEQNLGGAEAVFDKLGESIADMQITMSSTDAFGNVKNEVKSLAEVSEDAYRTMGISQSDYLASINKMGALFQGSGLEQQEALDLSANAMQRAADVASVMGLDMQAAMESVTGAAKGNFTMMDNLGVAMNATTLEAYALKNGLIAESEASVDVKKVADAQDKARKATLDVEKAQISYNEAVAKYGENSAQAQKALVSLEKTQVSLETATRHVDEAMAGADESSSGWWNNASNADKARVAMQMFLETTEQYDGNFAREANETISGSFGLLESSLSSLTAGLGNADADIEHLTGNVVDALLSVTKNVIPVVESIGEALPQAISTLAAGAKQHLPALIKTLLNAAKSIIQSLRTVLPDIISAVREIMPDLVSAFAEAMPLVLEMGGEILMALVDGVIENIDQVIDAAILVIQKLADGLIQNLPKIVDAAITLVVKLADALTENIDMVINAAVMLITTLATSLLSKDNLTKIIHAAIDLIIALANALTNPSTLSTLIDAIPEIIGAIVDALVDNAGDLITGAFEIITSLVTGLFKKENLDKLFDAGKKILDKIWEGIKSLFNNLLDWFAGIGTDIGYKVADWVEDAKQWGMDLIQNFIDGCKEVWNKWEGFWEGVGETIYDYLHHSTPEKGPLKDDDKWGADFMDNFITGAAGKEDELVKTVDDIADSVSDAMRIDAPEIEVPDFDLPDYTPVRIPVTIEPELDSIEPEFSFDGVQRSLHIDGEQTVIMMVDPEMMAKLDQILGAVQDGKEILLDGDALVGGTAGKYNTAFGEMAVLSERSVT